MNWQHRNYLLSMREINRLRSYWQESISDATGTITPVPPTIENFAVVLVNYIRRVRHINMAAEFGDAIDWLETLEK